MLRFARIIAILVHAVRTSARQIAAAGRAIPSAAPGSTAKVAAPPPRRAHGLYPRPVIAAPRLGNRRRRWVVALAAGIGPIAATIVVLVSGAGAVHGRLSAAPATQALELTVLGTVTAVVVGAGAWRIAIRLRDRAGDRTRAQYETVTRAAD